MGILIVIAARFLVKDPLDTNSPCLIAARISFK